MPDYFGLLPDCLPDYFGLFADYFGLLPNKKENLVKVYEGNKWVYKNKSETISDLVDSKYNIIDDHYDDLDSKDEVSPHVKTTFTKFRKVYDEGDAEMVEKLKKECELVLLNNR